MKLRVRGNSIRLRLSQSELATLLENGVVEERLDFPAGAVLRYRLERVGTGEATAELVDGTIAVRFPFDAIAAWAAPGEISLEAEQRLGDGRVLSLLVEKDFQCLEPRGDEEDEDLFPNPGA